MPSGCGLRCARGNVFGASSKSGIADATSPSPSDGLNLLTQGALDDVAQASDDKDRST